MKFKQRSYKKELIDGDPTFSDLKVNLDELHIINKYLGGYRISNNALKKLKTPKHAIIDIGSGGGHLIHFLYLHSKKAHNSQKFYGLDIKQHCIEYSQEVTKGSDIQFYCTDYLAAVKMEEIDLIHACLFFHHFKEEEIIAFIKECLIHKKTLIINDLERNPIAYYSIKLITKLFSKSYLVKNDAPLSVLRGFKRKEWNAMLREAGAKDYSIKNMWAFRHQIVIYA